MIRFYLAIICSACLIFSACKSNKYSAADLPDEQLQFGSSGGYAGITSTYILLRNGQLFHQQTAEATPKKVKSLRKKIGKQHFSKAESLHWDQMPNSTTGNMSYFIRLKKGDQEQLYTWTQTNSDPEMANWFETLNQLTQ